MRSDESRSVPIQSPSERLFQRRLGMLLIAFAGAVLLLAVCESMVGRAPLPMPAAWFTHRYLIVLLALVAMWEGCRRQVSPLRTPWRPRYAGMRFRKLVVYSRQGCCLCDDAIELLGQYRRYLPRVTVVDIDTDPALKAKFGELIPVVEFDGRVVYRGRVDEGLLRRLIEGTVPLDDD